MVLEQVTIRGCVFSHGFASSYLLTCIHTDRKDGQSIGFSVYVSIGMRYRIATFDSVKNHLVNYSYIYLMKNFYLLNESVYL
jgi:hypothetical protein